MGVMDKFLNYMKLNEDEEDEYGDGYYDDGDDDDNMEPAPRRTAPRTASARMEEEEPHADAARKPAHNNNAAGKVTPIRQSGRRPLTPSGMEVCVIKPSTFEDAREITETLLNNRTVVMNLEGLDVDVAQRILDFTAGSCFAINGNLQKISHYIFIITPSSVDVSGDFQDMFGNFDTTIFNN